MGYCVTQTESNIFIPKELFSHALKEIQYSVVGSTCGLSWVDIKQVLAAKDFCDAIRKCRWRATLDREGHLCNLSFHGEKLGDDFLLFKTIAPYVKEGSYISMVGEDHKAWRWFFKDAKCIEQRARIIWE